MYLLPLHTLGTSLHLIDVCRVYINQGLYGSYSFLTFDHFSWLRYSFPAILVSSLTFLWCNFLICRTNLGWLWCITTSFPVSFQCFSVNALCQQKSHGSYRCYPHIGVLYCSDFNIMCGFVSTFLRLCAMRLMIHALACVLMYTSYRAFTCFPLVVLSSCRCFEGFCCALCRWPFSNLISLWNALSLAKFNKTLSIRLFANVAYCCFLGSKYKYRMTCSFRCWRIVT